MSEPKRIIIVEDEEAILSSYKMILKRIDKAFEVEGYLDGETGLEALKLNPDYDLYIFDVNLPGILGTELLQYLIDCKMNLQDRVLMVSGHYTKEMFSQMHKARSLAFMTKPVDYKNFIIKIKRLLKV